MLKLNELRKEKRLTQELFAEKFGLFRQTYARYENEETQPPYDLLIEFADFYGVSLDYLLGRTEYRTISQNLTEKESKLLQAFGRLVPAMQDYTLEMIENLMKVSENGVKNG